MWLDRIRHCLLVIPGEPAFGVFKELRGVFLKGRQVMKGVDAVEGASVNEAHEQIPDVSPVLGFIEQRIFPMLDRPLKNLLTKVVVQWGPWNGYKQGQRPPMVEHIGNGLPHGGIAFHPPLTQLVL